MNVDSSQVEQCEAPKATSLTPTETVWVKAVANMIRETVLLRAGGEAALVADAVVAKLRLTPASTAEPERILLSSDEAAALLGITRRALAKRVERHQVPGVVRSGRKIEFNRAKLIAGLDRRTRA
jgi:hypothetical protein